jgi:glycosyltransferase involved in cell wall biosynthesis
VGVVVARLERLNFNRRRLQQRTDSNARIVHGIKHTYLKRRGGVESRFVVETGQASDDFARTIAREFPALAGAEVRVGVPALDALGASDACVATLWSTAYYVLKVRQTRRKFYLMQDYEPAFYPAGSEGALAENTYRFGFYGITTARGLRELYERQYGGIAEHLNICVDGTLFHPPAEGAADGGPPWRVVFYGRPEHPRNGFELGVVALTELKRRLGDRVEIVSIGDTWEPGRYGLDGVVRNLGFVSVQATADLYRRAHAGLVLMFSRHPAVIPLELMASGCPVVMNLNDATTWLYRDGANCRLAAPTAGCLADGLEAVLTDRALRATVIDGGRRTVRDSFSDWDRELERVYQFMLDPRARG